MKERNGDLEKATNKQLLQEVWQGLFGVNGTDDKGLIGDFKEFKEDQCKKVDRNTRIIYLLMGIIVIICSLLGVDIAGVFTP